MTFGANFKKLFVNSFCEMVLISVLVFVPSQILTNLVCFAILRSNMLTFRFDILSTLLSFLMCIAVAGVPVFLNIKAVSRKTPLSLISALDNSNHISSPGSSSDFIGYKFPDSTEILSVKRFRKYVIKIMLSTVTFAVAFVCCAYLGTSYSKTLNIIRPQYNIVFNGYYPSAPEEEDKEESAEQDKNNVTDNDISIEDQLKGDKEDSEDEPVKVYQYIYTDEVRDYLYSFNGIEMILKSCSTPAFDINSHVKILKKNAGSSGGADTDSGDRCYLNADFTVLDGEVAKSIEYFGYEIEGDLSKVVNNGKYIAITDGYNNSRKFKLSVGDKIFIATDFEYIKQTPVYQSSDLDYIMALKLNSCSYKYTEYTVGAIINNAPVGSSFPVYMNSEQYMKLTGNPVIFDDIDIIIKDGMTEAEYRELGFNLRHAADYYSNMNLTNTDAQVLSQIEKNKKYESVYMFVAVMLLAVTPVIWMFSQILFYLKRRPEFDLYFSLGAPRDKIKRLFIIDGIVMSAISSIIYIILCLIAAYGVTACLNMPFSGVSEYMRFSYTLPVIPFVIGLAVCALSAFASCIVPYITYIRSCHPIFVGGDLEDKKDIISEGETGV